MAPISGNRVLVSSKTFSNEFQSNDLREMILRVEQFTIYCTQIVKKTVSFLIQGGAINYDAQPQNNAHLTMGDFLWVFLRGVLVE